MENELLELLNKLVSEREDNWKEGNYGHREYTAAEEKALEVGRALVKLIKGY